MRGVSLDPREKNPRLAGSRGDVCKTVTESWHIAQYRDLA